MNYIEWRRTYGYMLKAYPDTHNMYEESPGDAIGKVTIERYELDGKYWVLKHTKTEEFNRTYYANCIDAIPFFRGLGGIETVKLGNIPNYGKIPVTIISTDPEGEKRVVRRFRWY